MVYQFGAALILNPSSPPSMASCLHLLECRQLSLSRVLQLLPYLLILLPAQALQQRVPHASPRRVEWARERCTATSYGTGHTQVRPFQSS